jgi:hypothetical protein
MRTTFSFFFFFFILVWLIPGLSYGLDTCRCGDRLVMIGDNASEVEEKCGPPSHADERMEERIERIFPSPYYSKDGVLREPIYARVQVKVEEWLYNFGPSRLMLTLSFENRKLVKIETGHYGH